MSNKNPVVEKILSLDELIISQRKKYKNSPALQKLNEAFKILNSIGLVEGVQMGGEDKRYFLIDGISWRRACNELNQLSTPNFILWEEGDFFSFMEKLVRDIK